MIDAIFWGVGLMIGATAAIFILSFVILGVAVGFIHFVEWLEGRK